MPPNGVRPLQVVDESCGRPRERARPHVDADRQRLRTQRGYRRDAGASPEDGLSRARRGGRCRARGDPAAPAAGRSRRRRPMSDQPKAHLEGRA